MRNQSQSKHKEVTEEKSIILKTSKKKKIKETQTRFFKKINEINKAIIRLT